MMDKEKIELTSEGINDIKEFIEKIDPDNKLFSQTEKLIEELNKNDNPDNPPVKINLLNKKN